MTTRYALVGPDSIVRNVTKAPEGWTAALGLTAVRSDTANVGDAYDPVMNSFGPGPHVIEEARARALEEVQRRRQELLDRGAPYQDRRIDLDDTTRANLSGMSITALLVSMGSLPGWPESYAQGWITVDNSRIALPTPQDGIALAAAVAGYYAALIQFARDAKDAILAAKDPAAAVAGIDWSRFEAVAVAAAARVPPAA